MSKKNNEDKLLGHVAGAPFRAINSGDYVFVSYSHDDTEEVFSDLKRFHEKGFQIWYDQGIPPTKNWMEEISKSLKNCKLFVVYITPNAIESENVRNEINLALNKEKQILAIYLTETELKYGLDLQLVQKQGILKYAMYDNQYETLVTETFEEYKITRTNKKPKPSKSKDFKYLQDLISSGEIHIKLDDDIVLDNSEKNLFKEGIVLTTDNLVIDGDNHFIDANSLSRIFKIVANNVTIKNLILKNGHVFNISGQKHIDGGGAIFIEKNTSLTLKDCKFINNYSESDGGALFNRGRLSSIKDCIFEDNYSTTSGGAIANFNFAKIISSSFKNNESNNGGAIYNADDSNLNVYMCRLRENKASFAGGIYNYGQLNIEENSNFTSNTSNWGGAILNIGNSKIINATFKKNSAIIGGAIFNINKGKLMSNSFNSSIFENEKGAVKLVDCIFASNDAEQLGGVIANLSKCKLYKCTLGNNTANNYGHIISNGPQGIFDENDTYLTNNYLALLNISDCDFKIKESLESHAIYNQKNCLLEVSCDIMINNQYPNKNSRIFLNRGDIEFI